MQAELISTNTWASVKCTKQNRGCCKHGLSAAVYTWRKMAGCHHSSAAEWASDCAAWMKQLMLLCLNEINCWGKSQWSCCHYLHTTLIYLPLPVFINQRKFISIQLYHTSLRINSIFSKAFKHIKLQPVSIRSKCRQVQGQVAWRTTCSILVWQKEMDWKLGTGVWEGPVIRRVGGKSEDI